MQPKGKAQELFAAFSQINEKAFADERLLSCPNLSKAPNYGNVLRRYTLGTTGGPWKTRAAFRLCFRYLLTNISHLLFLLLGKIYLLLLGWKLPAPLNTPDTCTAGRLLILDTFAVLPKIASDGKYSELYLPKLEDADTDLQCLRLYRLYGSRNPVLLWKAFKILAADKRGFTEQHLLSFSDGLLLLRHLLCYPFSLFRLIRKLKPYAPKTPQAAIRSALVHTAGQCIMTGESRRLAAYRLGLLLAACQKKSNFVKIISWYENQTVNKCFYSGLRKAGQVTGIHIPGIGAQLFIWPDNLLNNHPDDGELKFGLCPDSILVNGPYFLPQASRQSYAVGPALRYAHLFTGPVQPKKSKSLLVLLSYHPDECKRVLHLVLPLAERGDDVIYKFHPATSQEQFKALLPANPRTATGSLKEALQNTGAVIGSGSGSLAEAVAAGIPVLNVAPPGGFAGLALNYLPEYGRNYLWAEVDSPDDLEPSLKKLLEYRNAPQRQAETEKFKALLFTDPNDNFIRQAFELAGGASGGSRGAAS